MEATKYLQTAALYLRITRVRIQLQVTLYIWECGRNHLRNVIPVVSRSFSYLWAPGFSMLCLVCYIMMSESMQGKLGEYLMKVIIIVFFKKL